MEITLINNQQTNFGAVNKAYLKTAKEMTRNTKDVNLVMLVQDVFVDAVEEGSMSKLDAIDTLGAIRKLNICKDTKDFIVDMQTQLGKLAILDEFCSPFSKNKL